MKYVGGLGLLLLLIGSYIGLFVAPAERHMGDVARIMYVYVPSAWVAIVCYTIAFVLAIMSLAKEKPVTDARMVGAGHPEGVVAAHAVVAGQDVLQGVVQCMADMQHAGDVGRRDDDGK